MQIMSIADANQRSVQSIVGVWKYVNSFESLSQHHRHGQVGCLARAAHLLTDNAGVLRLAQWDSKSNVARRGNKSLFDFHFQCN